MADAMVSEGRLHWLGQSALSRRVSGFCAFEAAYFFGFFYGMSFSGACASPFWFPDAVLLCALLLTKPRNWWVFIVGTLPIRLFSPVAHGLPTGFLLATFSIDSAKGLLAAAGLRRFCKNPIQMRTLAEFAVFSFFAALLVPAVAAFGGAAARSALGNGYWTSWQQWFMGNASVHLVVTPAILYWLFGWRREMNMASATRCLEGGVVAIGLIVTARMSFSPGMDGMDFPMVCFYAPIPLLFWAALRFGLGGASVASAILTFFSIDAAIHGRGPFFQQSPANAALILQEYLLFRCVPLYVVAILIQQRDDAEHSLRESEERFRTMANTAPVMIWMVGRDMGCTFCNRGWLDFTGRTLEQELGDGWVEGVHPEDQQRCLQTYNSSFDARRPCEMEYRLRRHDGEYRWVLDRGVPRYAPDGEFVGYIGSVVDLTDRKHAEEARQDLAHASRLAVVGEFTAMIAHELNQPLAAILNNVDSAKILLDVKVAPVEEIRRVLADIREDNIRASEVIRRIRALVSKHEMEMQVVDVNATVAEVVRLVKGDALRRGVQVHGKYDAAVSTVYGDVVHLQQVVLNLVLNGMDAMKDNAETERHLFVTTTGDEEGIVEVAVKDVGKGVPPENLSRVFDSFFTTKREGMGIGLSMVRSIVGLHGGRVWAENNKDSRGTTFRFTLPTIVTTPRHAPQPTRGNLVGKG
jgi:PAS domain S-box-containing protein